MSTVDNFFEEAIENKLDNLNNPTASQDDTYTAGIGVTALAKTELEALNKLITQFSALINEQALSNSELNSILSLIENLNQTQQLLKGIVNDDYTQDDKHFLDWMDSFDNFSSGLLAELEDLMNRLFAYLDELKGLLDKGFTSLDGLADKINGLGDKIGGISTGINDVISSIPSFDRLYGDVVDKNNSYGTSENPEDILEYTWKKDWAAEAIKAAKEGRRLATKTYFGYRGRKLVDPNYLATGGKGNGLTQDALAKQLEEILSQFGYADGIENGPVTDTGLTVLHGSRSNPEYVLNND